MRKLSIVRCGMLHVSAGDKERCHGWPPVLGRDAPDVPLAVRGKASTEILERKLVRMSARQAASIEIISRFLAANEYESVLLHSRLLANCGQSGRPEATLTSHEDKKDPTENEITRPVGEDRKAPNEHTRSCLEHVGVPFAPSRSSSWTLLSNSEPIPISSVSFAWSAVQSGSDIGENQKDAG
ncbi:hypothetical protein BDP81DRAFT_182377 [Colletotrichum phormii]|uniref:Uncharacterized protein n=1 Tax=Colletotrichum phormii TaxID=359342 RepID=A0AAI9ZXJ9_9PEZI|nr:uncharacterized protein BDP81DRAFT_182377 [Colletotrichum phormii]KAK1639726.1 hypothetical protein BDP81DRAFT_182377 [Colletotrichum phormii]